VKPSNKWVLFSGLTGLGLILIGGIAYWRERKVALAGLGRSNSVGQAPVVGGYSDGNMRTVLRAANDIPIEQRLASIQDLVHKSVQDPQMRKVALQATAKCPERDQMCEAKAVYDYVKQRIRYTGDIGPIRHPDGTVEGIDLYQSARRTLEMGGGDCDDQAILNATLLALNGLTPKLRVVRQKKDPDWSHIMAGALINGKFVALDTTLPGNDSFGTELPVAKSIDFDA
jgi:transglutaminase superfamily protein